MSLQVIKAGILDTIQDEGRFGYQHLGINTGGSADRYAAALANALLGKECAAPVLECHFPAAKIMFEEATVVCITGADFSPQANGESIPVNQPVVMGKNSLLQFSKPVSGMRCYIAVLHSLELLPWLNSYSTNIKAGAGGFMGRTLKKGDRIGFKQDIKLPTVPEQSTRVLSWKAQEREAPSGAVSIRPGPEWNWLTKDAQEKLLQYPFYIMADSDRMGLRLNGPTLVAAEQRSLVSSAVTFGTIQLLPSGQLIVLMADHQTTGGYPRIAHVITTDLSLLAQMRRGETLTFQSSSLEDAEARIIARYRYLEQLKSSSQLRMSEWIRKENTL
jgi:antagonist of KipI